MLVTLSALDCVAAFATSPAVPSHAPNAPCALASPPPSRSARADGAAPRRLRRGSRRRGCYRAVQSRRTPRTRLALRLRLRLPQHAGGARARRGSSAALHAPSLPGPRLEGTRLANISDANVWVHTDAARTV